MDNIAHVKNEKGACGRPPEQPHLIVSFLYIGTFGSFIGFGRLGQFSPPVGTHSSGRKDRPVKSLPDLLGLLVGH